MPKWVLRHLWLFAFFAVAQTAAAQSASSSIIGELHFTGSHHYNDALLAATSGLKPGDSVTQEQLQAAADRFVQLGVFARANYRYTTKAGKLSVEFVIEDAPTVPVTFDNFPWFTDDELVAAIRAAVPLFDGTAPLDGGMLAQMDAALTALLPKRKVEGTIEHTLMAEALEDGMMVQFRVVGPTLTVGEIQYGDSLAQDSAALHDRNLDLVGKPFSRFSIQLFENEQVKPIYLQSGHLRAQFGPPQARFTGDPNKPLSDKILVVLPIDPGRVYNMFDVTATGNALLSAADITKLTAMDAGQLADGMKLADAWQRIEKEYHHHGYLDAKVEPKPEYNEEGATVSYRLAITEGPQYHMHDLILTGLSPEAMDAVRLRWELHPGTILDGAYVDDMLAKLEKPNEEIFGKLPVHYQKLGNWLRTDPQTKTVDVLLDFQ